MLNSMRLGLSLLSIMAGFWGYYYPNAHLLVRLCFLLFGLVISVGFVYSLPMGVSMRLFLKEAYKEMLKVVWPGRKETLQAALLVATFCFLLALYLWVVDRVLSWGIYSLVLGWS